MKKMFVLAVFLLNVFAANAQVRFGLKAGYDLTGVKIKTDDYYTYFLRSLNYSKVSGFHAGVIADVAWGEHFSFQPGLLYTLRGYDAAGVVPGPADGPTDASIKTRYHYLELPANFLYKYSLGPGKLFAGAGPFLSYGISGRVKAEYEAYDSPERTVVFLDKQGDYNTAITNRQYLRPFNAGVSFTLGYEFNTGILISGNYNLGMTDVEPESNLSQKSRSWGISIGYLFNNEK
ncbi:outer membrane beta-barrel protein [Chitinophaga sp. SYP-B3965]|uniref:porin family protein n=1 Tax=Chitinophaga sp. SYP-B3965 TaxID=2663120 RepID=UPI0012995B19|nr:porin family protein [Chitinophaga sp. SYP-B3965]MRG43925.1 outer membrane beta-barrel protein [Chitinophaga sp. SYP-B3965]